MGETMTPSKKTITDGQIEKAAASLRDALRKHRKEFDSEAFQRVLGINNLGMELLNPFRKPLGKVSDLISHRVTVDRSLSPEAALEATGRRFLFIDDEVVANMPKAENDRVEIVFFNVGYSVTSDELEKEYELRGLIAADPFSLAAVNAIDPEFADNRPNLTHWRNGDGKWCHASFSKSHGERHLSVDLTDLQPPFNAWWGLFWFAGFRK